MGTERVPAEGREDYQEQPLIEQDRSSWNPVKEARDLCTVPGVPTLLR